MSLYETLVIIVSAISVSMALTALFFSRKDKPSLMPCENVFIPYKNVSFLGLNWKNTSGKVVHDVSILINCFNVKLHEITEMKKEDKFYFSIANDGKFHYSIEAPPPEQFFIRVRFKGKYYSWLPFKKFVFTQSIWYTMLPLFDKEKALCGFQTYQTFNQSIDKIQVKYKTILKRYEKGIDKRF